MSPEPSAKRRADKKKRETEAICQHSNPFSVRVNASRWKHKQQLSVTDAESPGFDRRFGHVISSSAEDKNKQRLNRPKTGVIDPKTRTILSLYPLCSGVIRRRPTLERLFVAKSAFRFLNELLLHYESPIIRHATVFQ
jgi:hypothetical protein